MDELKVCRMLKTNINVTSMQQTLDFITENFEQLRGKYICVSNVHTTVMSYENSAYNNVQNSAVMALPDGKPLSIVSSLKGHKDAQRVTGPDLMVEMFKCSKNKPLRHYFYGSTQETLDIMVKNINENYPDTQIAGVYSPPFRQLTEEEDKQVIEQINQAEPDVVWVGLGAPKQENWMYDHRDKINAVMIGVGAGFDYQAGTIKRAPVWMQKLALEWLYRLVQDPKRLFKRYITTNFKFLYLVLMESLRERNHKE